MPNNLNAFIPELWSLNVLRNLDQINVAMNFTNRTYEDQVLRFGDTVHVRTFGNIAIQGYARGQTIAPQSLAPLDETLIVDDGAYFAFDVDDLDRVQSDLNAVQGYTSRAAVGFSNYIDSYIFAAYSSALTANRITSGGSAIDVSPNTASTAVYELLVEANKRLTEQNVPRTGRWIVVTPYVESLLLKSTTYFLRASDLGDSVVTTGRFPGGGASPGFIGRCAGFDVYTSNNLPSDSGGFYCLYGQDSPISYAAQLSPGNVRSHDLEDTFAIRVKGLMLHGKKVFAEDAKKLGYIYVDNS